MVVEGEDEGQRNPVTQGDAANDVNAAVAIKPGHRRTDARQFDKDGGKTNQRRAHKKLENAKAQVVRCPL